MSDSEVDRDLKTAFSTLRNAEQEQLPSFTEVVRRARSSDTRMPQRPALRWAAAVGVLVVLAAWLGLRTSGPRVLPGTSPSLAEWRSPTAFLLQTSGRELLSAPAGWNRSLIDFKSDTTSLPERKYPS